MDLPSSALADALRDLGVAVGTLNKVDCSHGCTFQVVGIESTSSEEHVRERYPDHRLVVCVSVASLDMNMGARRIRQLVRDAALSELHVGAPYGDGPNWPGQRNIYACAPHAPVIVMTTEVLDMHGVSKDGEDVDLEYVYEYPFDETPF